MGTTTSEPAEVRLSVVMPCLNEARTVGTCVRKARACLQELATAGEVIVADNGSTDESAAVARSEGARIVHAQRRGYGNALQAGIAAARGAFIIMGDADDSYDFGNLRPFLGRLEDGFDLVLGNRFRGEIKPGAMPWLNRHVGNPLLTGLMNVLFHTTVGDAHCGLRAFRKEAYRQWGVTCPGMEFASAMVVQAVLCRSRIAEIPIILYPDGRQRRPHLRPFRDGFRHIGALLGMFLRRQWDGGRRNGGVKTPAWNETDLFDSSHYARTIGQKLRRCLELGPKYYFRDLPRYFLRRRDLNLPLWDWRALLSPLRELLGGVPRLSGLPPVYGAALQRLRDTGVKLHLPPARIEALARAWWQTRDAAGDTIELGAYRGGTSLLLALLGELSGLRRTVLVFDTFQGSPEPTRFDLARRGGEFAPGPDQVATLRRQAAALGVVHRVEIHPGLFADSFRSLQERDLRLSFAHIDANLYESTRDACRFAIPRLSAGGIVVFDDYNGPCDLGARLAIDEYCGQARLPIVPLAGSSAWARVPEDRGGGSRCRLRG